MMFSGYPPNLTIEPDMLAICSFAGLLRHKEVVPLLKWLHHEHDSEKHLASLFWTNKGSYVFNNQT